MACQDCPSSYRKRTVSLRASVTHTHIRRYCFASRCPGCPLFLFALALASATQADGGVGSAVRLGAAGVWSDSRPHADLHRDATSFEGVALRAYFSLYGGRAASRRVLNGFPRVAREGRR